jgi:plastocyanin
MKKNKFVTIVSVIAGIGILISYFTYHNPAEQTPGNAQENKTSKSIQADEKIAPNTIEIKNYSFMPNKIKIKKGTTITWINRDIASHTVTIDDKNKGGPRSKFIKKGEKYTFTFSEVGIFPYHCQPHPYMKAVVEVVE